MTPQYQALRFSRWLIPISLVADVLLFFGRPLFSERYMFPWDFPNVQLPMMQFLADQFKRGELALWDPYTYCGNPIFANIQASLFHPLIVVAALASNWIGGGHLALLIEWSVILQVAVAGLAAYALMRELGVSRAAAWGTAVMVQTGPYFASRTEHIGVMMAASWMPVAWLAIVRLAKRGNPRSLALLGVALALAIFGGFPAATFAVFLSGVLLSVFLIVVRLASLRLLAFAFAGCVIGIGLAGIQFIPSVQLTNNSVAKYRLEWLGAGGGLKWESLVSLILPNHYHIFDLQNFNGPWDPSFLYLYSSLLGLLFALLTVFLIRDSAVLAFTLLALFGAVLMLGDSTSIFRLVYPWVPERARIGIHPEYTYCIFTHALAVLAGFGLNRFVRWPSLQWTVAIIIATDLYLVGSNRPMNCGPGGDATGISTHAVDQHPEQLSLLRTLSRSEIPPARIDAMDTSIAWAQAATMTRVPTSNGASPLAQERIIQIRLGLGGKNGRKSGWYYPIVDPASSMIDLLGDKYLLVGNKSVSRGRSVSKLRLLSQTGQATLFENRNVFPRVFLVGSIRSTDFESAVTFLRAPNSKLLDEAAVEGSVSLPPSHNPGSGTARITKYSANQLAIAVETKSPAYLIVLEAWYPGWKARIDGIATPIYPTDVAFRGLVIPAGRHTITMSFEPKILSYSAGISLIFFVLTAALWLREDPKKPCPARPTPIL